MRYDTLIQEDRTHTSSNFILLELSVQAQHELHLWGGQTTHKLRRVNGALKMFGKKVVLVNAAEAIPNLSFLREH